MTGVLKEPHAQPGPAIAALATGVLALGAASAVAAPHQKHPRRQVIPDLGAGRHGGPSGTHLVNGTEPFTGNLI